MALREKKEEKKGNNSLLRKIKVYFLRTETRSTLKVVISVLSAFSNQNSLLHS